MQAQIVNLLQDLKRDLALALIFISHDLSVVKHISDRIMVFYLGRTMEYGAASDLVRMPRHPYTRALIATAPVPDPAIERGREVTALKGELPSPLAPPSGCVFRTRCPIARPTCANEPPAMQVFAGDHVAACPFGERSKNRTSFGGLHYPSIPPLRASSHTCGIACLLRVV